MFGKNLSQPVELGLNLSLFKHPGLVDQPGQLEDFLAERGRVDGGHHVLKLGEDFLLLLLGQVVEVLGELPGDLFLAVGLRVIKYLLPLNKWLIQSMKLLKIP